LISGNVNYTYVDFMFTVFGVFVIMLCYTCNVPFTHTGLTVELGIMHVNSYWWIT